MRLLLVEDDERLSAALARGLRGEGYAVDVAATGEDAIAQARVYEYDVVHLDVMLPGPDEYLLRRAGEVVSRSDLLEHVSGTATSRAQPTLSMSTSAICAASSRSRSVGR